MAHSWKHSVKSALLIALKTPGATGSLNCRGRWYVVAGFFSPLQIFFVNMPHKFVHVRNMVVILMVDMQYHHLTKLKTFTNKNGLLCLFGSPSNTMSPGPRPTSVPSGILTHPTVCPQYTSTSQTDKTGQKTVR